MTIEAILASLHLLAILTFVVFLSSQEIGRAHV